VDCNPALTSAPTTPTSPHKHRATVIDRAIEKSIYINDDDVRNSQTLREVALDWISTYKGQNTFVQDIAVKLADRGTLSIPQMRGALNTMVREARDQREQARSQRIVDGANARIDAMIARDDQYLANMGMRRAGADETPFAVVTCNSGNRVPAVIHIDTETRKWAAYYEAAAVDEDDKGPSFIDLRSREDKQRADAADVLPTNEATEATEAMPVIPNGTYTIVLDSNDPNRAYRTLRVSNAPAHFTVSAGTQVISYLAGPDNSSDYKSFAFLTGSRIGIWKSFRQSADLIKAANMLVVDPMTHARAYVLRSKKCFVCDRPLTTPQSIKAGIGPICAEKIGALGYRLLMGTKDAAIEDADNREALRLKAQADMDELFPEKL
jgi:hypothetical protein